MAMKMKNELKIGIMVVVAIIALIFGLNYLNGNSLFSSDKKFYTTYKNVLGLTEAAVVQINGFVVGKVVSIELQPDKSIKVGFIVKEEINIPQGSFAKLTTNDFISGAKVISLQLAENNRYIPDEGFVQSKESEGVLDNISETVTPLVGTMRTTLVTLDTLLLSINTIINEQARMHLDNSFKSLDITLQELSVLSKNLNNQTQSLGSLMDGANSVVNNFATNNEKINTSLSSIESFTTKLSNTEVDKTLNSLQRASEDLRGFVAKVNDSSGSLGMILSDKKLYNNLTSTLGSLDTLIMDVKDHPAKYINISVFGSKSR